MNQEATYEETPNEEAQQAPATKLMRINAIRADALPEIETWQYFIPVRKEDYHNWLTSTQAPIQCYAIEYGFVLDPATGQIYQPVSRQTWLEVRSMQCEEETAHTQPIAQQPSER